MAPIIPAVLQSMSGALQLYVGWCRHTLAAALTLLQRDAHSYEQTAVLSNELGDTAVDSDGDVLGLEALLMAQLEFLRALQRCSVFAKQAIQSMHMLLLLWRQ